MANRPEQSTGECPYVSALRPMANLPVLLSAHAQEAIRRRGLDPAMVVDIASAPEQIIPSGAGREVRQSRRRDNRGLKMYLIRVIVDVEPHGSTIVTAYRTSRIAKYWRS